MSRVLLDGVKKIYPGGVEAVHKSTLEVKDKEFMVLVGPSGCGKTTTLRMVAGLEEITEGRVLIGERLVNEVLPKDRNIAMVFQNYAIYPHMTVFDNLAFGLRQRKTPKPEIERLVRETAKVLGIGELLERRPKALSGGQRQRVAVGRAIVRQPEVFLFDEPLSNLDAKMRVEMRKEIKMLHQRLQTTIIYVTHDQVEAMTLGDRVCVMNDGYIEQVGPPITVYDFPKTRFVAGFIGTPPMNFLSGQLARSGAGPVFEGNGFKLKLPASFDEMVTGREGKDIELGIRPEDLVQSDDATADGAYIPGKVQIIEALGNELLAYIKQGKNTIIWRCDAHTDVSINHELKLTPAVDKIHVFDCETGENLVHG